MSRKTLKIGLIGCGYMGNYYAHNISANPGVEVAVCCDPSEQKLAKYSKKWNITNGYTDWRQLLKSRDFLKLDGIINCSTDILHSEVFKYCIEESIPLLSEKPPALPLKLLKELTQTVGVNEFCSSKFMINFSKRCLPAVYSANNFINQGEIGKLVRIELHYRQGWLFNNDFGDWHNTSAWFWRLTNKLSHHGVLGDLGSHLLDLAVFFGGSIETIEAMLTTFPKDPSELNGYELNSPDDAVCILRFKSGASGLVSATRALPGDADELEFTVSGTKGTIRIKPSKNKNSFKVFRCKGCGKDEGWEIVENLKIVERNYEIFFSLLENLRDESKLVNNYSPGITEAVINQVLIDAAVESSVSGKAVMIDDLINERLGAEWLWVNRKI